MTFKYQFSFDANPSVVDQIHAYILLNNFSLVSKTCTVGIVYDETRRKAVVTIDGFDITVLIALNRVFRGFAKSYGESLGFSSWNLGAIFVPQVYDRIDAFSVPDEAGGYGYVVISYEEAVMFLLGNNRINYINQINHLKYPAILGSEEKECYGYHTYDNMDVGDVVQSLEEKLKFYRNVQATFEATEPRQESPKEFHSTPLDPDCDNVLYVKRIH